MHFNFKKFPVTCPVVDLSSLPDRTLECFVTYTPTLVSEHLSRTLVDSSQDKIQSIASDVDLLFRLQNGQKIDKAIAEELLNRMSSNLDNSLKEIFDNASDEDILDSIRSKYIQTPAQLESYLRSLDSRLADLSSQDLQDAIDSGEPAKDLTDNNKPASAPASASASAPVAEPSSPK